jgi:adenosylcobinamide-phosphate synthase
MNEKYINFGKFSAKTDDVTNYIPARLSGILIPLSSFFCGMVFLKSFSIMIRDRKNHKSPNSAYPEAAVAGALGIRLGGPYPHFGKIVEKQTIGELVKEVELADILKAIKLMHIATFVFLIFSLGILVFYNTI